MWVPPNRNKKMSHGTSDTKKKIILQVRNWLYIYKRILYMHNLLMMILDVYACVQMVIKSRDQGVVECKTVINS